VELNIDGLPDIIDLCGHLEWLFQYLGRRAVKPHFLLRAAEVNNMGIVCMK
jgi:hypothetical protein